MYAIFFRPWPLLALPALLACGSAQAGRPMLVDDATITPAGLCQTESWTQRSARQTEYWLVPACNAGAGWELSAGVGRLGADGPGRAIGAGLVQAKTILHPLDPNGWGIGLTLANQFQEGPDTAGNWSVLVPVSVSLVNDAVQVHANLGVLHGVDGRAHDRSWGLGTEWAVDSRLTLTFEVDGAQHARAVTQAGLRYALRADRILLNAAFGRLLGRDDHTSAGTGRYVTLGLTLIGPGLR
jgi:hypothetical protein